MAIFNYRRFNFVLIIFLALLSLLYGGVLLFSGGMGLDVPAGAFKISGMPNFWALVAKFVFLVAAIIRLFNSRINIIRILCVLCFLYFATVTVLDLINFNYSLGIPFALISFTISLLALKVSR